MSAYIYAANVVCPVTHLALGNALAAAIDPDVGGAETFDKGLRCYPAGTTFSGLGQARTPSQADTARATFPLLTEGGYSKIAEFISSGPWPQLNALGFSDAQISAAKAALRIEAGPRAEYESRGVAFVQSLGYVV